MLFDKKIIHPTIKIPYEGFTVHCSRDTKAFLDTFREFFTLKSISSLVGSNGLFCEIISHKSDIYSPYQNNKKLLCRP